MDRDADVLKRVTETKDFFGSALRDDNLGDWNLARDLGDFLLRIDPDEVMGYALLVRAYRHLGDLRSARGAFDQCCARWNQQMQRAPGEAELFEPFFAKERILLLEAESGSDADKVVE